VLAGYTIWNYGEEGVRMGEAERMGKEEDSTERNRPKLYYLFVCLMPFTSNTPQYINPSQQQGIADPTQQRHTRASDPCIMVLHFGDCLLAWSSSLDEMVTMVPGSDGIGSLQHQCS
jgi:hypothetical protein